MNHFGIAFGTIVVGVIGGAFALNHHWARDGKFEKAPAAVSQTQPAPPVAPVAEAPSTDNSKVAVLEEEKVKPAAASAPRAPEPAKSVATNSRSKVTTGTTTTTSRRGSANVEPSTAPATPASTPSDNAPVIATAPPSPTPAPSPAPEVQSSATVTSAPTSTPSSDDSTK